MRAALIIILLVLLGSSSAAQAQIVGVGNEPNAGAMSTTDAIPVCQFNTGSQCGTGDTTQPLHRMTGTQFSNFVAAQGFITGASPTITTPTISSPTLTGTPVAPTPAQSANSTQIATTAWTKLNHWTMGAAWLIGATPGGGLIGSVRQALTIYSMTCDLTSSGDSGTTVDVYTVVSGSGQAGTKLSTTSCSPSGTAFTDQAMIAANVNVAAGQILYLGSTGSFGNSAGGVTLEVGWQ